MNYQQWKATSPRQKAFWPAADKGYLQPQHKVMISLDRDLAEWLVGNVVGRSSFTGDMEETIVSALRVMRGDLPLTALPLQRTKARPDR